MSRWFNEYQRSKVIYAIDAALGSLEVCGYRPPQVEQIAAEKIFDALAPLWYPIETAPRDGTRLLLYASPYGAGSGQWSCRQELSEGYFPVEGHWKFHFCLNKEVQPTHWMPLPGCPA